MTSQPTFGESQLPGGVRLRYAEQGPRNREALLMLHGWSDSWFSFSRVLPLLPPELRVIAPDQRGHGESDRPAEGYTMETFARDAMALMDSLGISRATVVGHSMGSFVAQQVAALAPERVSHLVLVGSAVTCRHEEVRDLLDAARNFTDPLDESLIGEFQASTIHRPVPPEFFERVVAESLKLPARAWNALAEEFRRFDSRERVGKIQSPVLVLWGEKDGAFLRPQQDELLRCIPAATFKTYSDVGHSPHWEVPEQFVRDVLAFCGEGG